MKMIHSICPESYSQGSRSLPSCLGGGDLDGDEYNVTNYGPFVKIKCQGAAAYNSAPRKETSEKCTMHDVAEFLTDYIISDVSCVTNILTLRSR